MDKRYHSTIIKLDRIVNDAMKKFIAIWKEIGYEDEFIEERCIKIVDHFQELFDDMLKEESENKDFLIKKIEDYLKEAADLKKDLGVEVDVSGYEVFPLHRVERMLNQRLVTFRKVKEERLSTFNNLRNREQALCESLGMQPKTFQNVVLTEQELCDFRKYLDEKDAEKAQLIHEFQKTKSLIQSLIRELEIAPTLEFEKLVVCKEDEAFRPTKENMKLLMEFHQRLEQQLQENETEAEELREKLSELWNRLHEAHSFKDVFLGSHRGHSKNTITALKEEIKRCEELKRRNIKQFVTEIRKELLSWWNRCSIPEEERKLFLPYSSECFTEDLLDLHELEVKKCRTFYEENMDIFQLAEERQELWNKMIQLEEKANDPDRLFQNRGGQLLLEEKERKKIQKELPKMEKELLKHVRAYEEKNGKPFTLFGQNIMDIIENQWLLHNNRKERKKEAKKIERTRMLEVESKLGSQRSPSKRKRCNGTFQPERTTKIGRVDENRPFVSQRRLMTSRNVLGQKLDALNADMTTYTDFQDHLEAVDRAAICRSSIRPDRYLRECNTPAKTPSKISSTISTYSLKKTPKVTPLKPVRKNILTTPNSTPRTAAPRTVTPRTVTPRTAAPRTVTPQTVPRIRNVTSPRFQRGMATTPRLTVARVKLPIIF